MLKRAIFWFVPVLIVAIFALAFLVLPSVGSHAASLSHPVAGGSATPTATSTSGGMSPNILWNGQ
jgi:hypothetical protein